MKMTIDEAINHGEEQLEIFGGDHKEFIETAINIMRKYQQMKADYENRLKADMVAMLTDLQLEIEEYDVIGNHSTGSYDADLYNGAYSDGMARASSIIQQKIDALKEVDT